jgi:hypothetical protein
VGQLFGGLVELGGEMEEGRRGRGGVRSILLLRIFPEMPTLACHLRGALWITPSCGSRTRLDLRGASAENGQIPAFENPALI